MANFSFFSQQMCLVAGRSLGTHVLGGLFFKFERHGSRKSPHFGGGLKTCWFLALVTLVLEAWGERPGGRCHFKAAL